MTSDHRDPMELLGRMEKMVCVCMLRSSSKAHFEDCPQHLLPALRAAIEALQDMVTNSEYERNIFRIESIELDAKIEVLEDRIKELTTHTPERMEL